MLNNSQGLRGATSGQQSQSTFMDSLMSAVSGGGAGGGSSDIASLLQSNPALAQQIIDILNSNQQGQSAQGGQMSGQGMFTNFNGRQKKESPLQKANDAMSIGGMLGGLFGGSSGSGGSGSSGGGFGGFFGG